MTKQFHPPSGFNNRALTIALSLLMYQAGVEIPHTRLAFFIHKKTGGESRFVCYKCISYCDPSAMNFRYNPFSPKMDNPVFFG